MNTTALAADLRRRSFTLAERAGKLLVSPASALTEGDTALIRQHRDGLLCLLADEERARAEGWRPITCLGQPFWEREGRIANLDDALLPQEWHPYPTCRCGKVTADCPVCQTGAVSGLPAVDPESPEAVARDLARRKAKAPKRRPPETPAALFDEK